MPPRHLKSISASVALPAWVMGRNPGLKVMVASYGEELGRDHAISFQRVVTSAWYCGLFPQMGIKPRGERQLELRTCPQGGLARRRHDRLRGGSDRQSTI
jgi:hypothetical protein